LAVAITLLADPTVQYCRVHFHWKPRLHVICVSRRQALVSVKFRNERHMWRYEFHPTHL